MHIDLSFRLKQWIVMGVGAVGAALAQANVSTPDVALSALPHIAQKWLQTAAEQALSSTDKAKCLRVETQVGVIDSRLRLAPCKQVEAYAPTGVRLWGATRVGLRCVDGVARWNITVPATVKAYGPAWVVKTPVAAGALLTPADVTEVEVDWAQEASPVLADASAWVGQAATRLLSTGQILRQGMVKAPQVFQAGAPVRVVVQGTGFSVAADGQALSAGVVGQAARVRMDNGRIASGLVVDGRTVRIEL